MLNNNPMKNDETKKKVSNILKQKYKNGQLVPKNKITEKFTFNCLYCKKENNLRNTAKNRKKKFCGKSCSASYSNKKRYISHTPATHANI